MTRVARFNRILASMILDLHLLHGACRFVSKLIIWLMLFILLIGTHIYIYVRRRCVCFSNPMTFLVPMVQHILITTRLYPAPTKLIMDEYTLNIIEMMKIEINPVRTGWTGCLFSLKTGEPDRFYISANTWAGIVWSIMHKRPIYGLFII